MQGVVTEYSAERDRWEVMISLEKAPLGLEGFPLGFRVWGLGFRAGRS